jgi:hypothetical protein
MIYQSSFKCRIAGNDQYSLNFAVFKCYDWRECLMDNELISRRFEIESKLFFLDFKENPNGRYLKITEKSGDKKSFIIVPEGGLNAFLKELTEIINETDKLQ